MGKRKAFKIYVRLMEAEEVFYGSDGCVFIKDDVFEGYLTSDYISGTYDKEKLSVELRIYNSLVGREEGYYEFETKTNEFELPETYNLTNKNDSSYKLELIIKEIVSDYKAMKDKKETLLEIKALHGLPDILSK